MGLIVVALIGSLYYLYRAVDWRYQAAVAEADRLDPGWRLPEIEARRELLPETKNSALRVRAALDQLPKANAAKIQGSTSELDLWKRLGEIKPNEPLDPNLSASLRAELANVANALDLARGLADMPKGRSSVAWAKNPLNTQLDQAQNVRRVARLLWLDAMLRAQDGDVDGALDTCRAAINAGRSIGDEPIDLSQLVRGSIGQLTISAIERTLAQGEPSDRALRAVQQLLADEAAYPLALIALRGERASSDDLLGRLATGEVDISELSGQPPPPPSRRKPIGPQQVAFYRYNQALCLEFMNEAVEIAKKPDQEQPALWKRWEEEVKPEGGFMALGSLVSLLLPPKGFIGEMGLRYHATLNCAVVALALERYRLARGRWPGSLDELVPTYLARVPDDPYAKDGHPRFLRLEDGLIVYSVGTDGRDDGGMIHMNARPSNKPGRDIGFRLWDVAHRRRPTTVPERVNP